MTQERFYIEAPAVDYLTLTMWQRDLFELVRSFVVSLSDGDGVEGQQLQYAGERGTGYFAGHGSQRGKDHYLVSASGAFSHDVARLAEEAATVLDGVRCSRLDVQVTVPLPVGMVRLSKLGEGLRAGDFGSFRRRGAAARVDTINSHEGLDTVYIGARSSARFIRIYVKSIDGKLFLRFEVEYKAELAVQAWDGLVTQGVGSLGPLLRSELDALPAAFVEALGGVYAACGGVSADRLRVVLGAPTWQAQLQWVMRQVWPTLEELMSTEAEYAIRQMMEDLLDGKRWTRKGVE